MRSYTIWIHMVPSLRQPSKATTRVLSHSPLGRSVYRTRSARFNPTSMWTEEHRWLHSPMFLWWIGQSQLWSQRKPPKSDTSRKKWPQVCTKFVGESDFSSVFFGFLKNLEPKTRTSVSRMCSGPLTSALPKQGFLRTSFQPFRW